MEINLGADTAGLYAMETATGEDSSKDGSAGESDYEKKKGKKEGKLGAKKKDKEDKKKDKQSYATLEGDSSPEDYSEMESLKSPFKGKKRSFKFSSRKDKKSKDEEKNKTATSSPKEAREPEIAEASGMSISKSSDKKLLESSDKKKEKKEKEKKEKKETKVKEKELSSKAKESSNKLVLKIKADKNKANSKSQPSLQDDLPIFGVPLELAVTRGRCHDGVDLPAVVRCCIDFIEEHGLQQEGIYRSSGLKTRVVELRRAFNNRENVSLEDVDPPVVASLLKQYLRELPENILTNELLPRFEEASGIKDAQQQEESFRNLIQLLPPCNRILLSWLMVHMEHVVEKERFNKMNVQNLSIVLCPTLNLTHRVLACLFAHSRALFSNTHVTRYIPPLSGVGVILPEELPAMAAELKKQESLLAQIHGEMSVGSVAKHREEQLWEAQRIVTQLKRQLKHHGPSHPPSATASVTAEKPSDVRPSHPHDDEELRLELAQPTEVPIEPKTAELPLEEATSEPAAPVSAPNPVEPPSSSKEALPGKEPLKADQLNDESGKAPQMSPQHVTVIEVGARAAQAPGLEGNGKRVARKPAESFAVLDSEKELELALMIENLEREKIIQELNDAIEKEQKSVEHLQELLAENAQAWTDSSDEDDVEFSEGQEQLLAEILRENRELEEQNGVLQLQIEEAREACLKARVQLRLFEERAKLMTAATVTASGMC